MRSSLADYTAGAGVVIASGDTVKATFKTFAPTGERVLAEHRPEKPGLASLHQTEQCVTVCQR